MGRKDTPIHLRPHAPVAERLLLTGDPGRALRLAQVLIDGPRMLNHHRGLWGYSGPAKSDGALLTIQGTGLGGPSAAAVVADLATLGGRRAIRVGTCEPVDGRAEPGDLLVVERVHAADGTSRSLGAQALLVPAPELTDRLARELPDARRGCLVSVDVHAGAPALDGALARDLASAAVLAAAARHGVTAAIVSVVTGPELGDEALHAAEVVAGTAALAALG